MKGQGALEYLIIVAAVLAITAVVVVFLTGAFKGVPAGVSECKSAAASCKTLLATAANPACAMCETSCADPVSGKDVMNSSSVVNSTTCTKTGGSAVGCSYCKQGLPTQIS